VPCETKGVAGNCHTHTKGCDKELPHNQSTGTRSASKQTRTGNDLGSQGKLNYAETLNKKYKMAAKVLM